MYTLGIDTTGPACSAAIVTQAGLVSSLSKHIGGRGHAEHLAPQVQTLLRSAGITAAQISRVSVCIGPGSFTGLRVGIALAKGLALPFKTPVIGISALEVWAKTVDPENARRVMAIADVRRGEVFWQTFDKGTAITPPKLGTIDQARAQKSADMIICGNGAALLGQTPDTGRIEPAILAWLCLDKSAQSAPPLPLYHRPPDAKLPGGITPK